MTDATKNTIAIDVQAVSKTFKLPHERTTSVKGAVVGFYRRKKTFEEQQVLKNISFTINNGDFFGILGRNGSGKSTLLKLLAGIYTPTKGHIQVHGQLTPFIELGVGFNPELTGKENVYLNGALLGFNRKEISAMYNEIVKFSELSRFMDQKLKNYSSGMQVRLAFSIAIQSQSPILLFDEVLAVGDAAFQAKCFAHFEKLKQEHKTIVFVSHDMEAVRRFCNRAIMLEHGQIIAEGSTQSVIDKYLALNVTQLDNSQPFGVENTVSRDQSTLKITDAWVEVDGHKEKNVEAAKYTLAVKVKFAKKCDNPVVGVILRNQQGLRTTASNTQWIGLKTGTFMPGDQRTFKFHFPNILERGSYYLSANVSSQDTAIFYDWQNDAQQVFFSREFLTGGVVNPNYKVEITNG